MRKILIGLFLAVFAYISFSFATQIRAADDTTNQPQTIVVPKTQTIEHDYVAAGSTVDVAGKINGDAYIAGGNVTIEGPIAGDLLVAGGNITIKGDVAGSVRVIGGNIIMSGAIGKNLSLVGGTVNLTDSAKIAGSIVSAGGTFNLYAPVGKDVRIAGGQVTLGGIVGGNALVSAGQLMLGSNAHIAGDMTYWSNEKATIASGALIVGSISMHQLPKNTPTTTQPTQVIQSLTIFVFFGKLIGFAAAFLIGFLFITFFPLYMQRLVSTAKKNFWTNFGVGLATAFVTPLIILLLFLTLIGIPLALFVGVLFAYSLYAARIIVAIVIGEWATGYFSKKIHMVWALFCRTFYL